MQQSDTGSAKITSERLFEFVKDAINLLMAGQVSETLILSSYKIATVLEERFGLVLPADRIGRALAKLGRLYNLKRLDTKIPKYELRTSQYRKMIALE